MKQSEIIIGKSYLFASTEHDHKKDMVGTIVIVTEKQSGKEKFAMFGRRVAPPKYKLSNGRYAKAAELKLIK